MKFVLLFLLPLVIFGLDWTEPATRPEASATELTRLVRGSSGAISFYEPVPLAPKGYSSGAVNLATADFNEDGAADVAVASADGSFSVYRGNNEALRRGRPNDTGYFAASGTLFNLGTRPDVLAAGDFNADGHPDLIAATKGDSSLYLTPGDGRGRFAAPIALPLDGRVTALASGDIGRRDGQADIAVAVENQNGAYLLVYEHPEGAFSHTPEAYRLPAPATSVTIGQFDRDWYSDIAVAAGDSLVVIHGRGQAYPWDLDPDLGISRPAAVVESRKFGEPIRELVSGDFMGRGKDQLALVSSSGALSLLSPESRRRRTRGISAGVKTSAAGFIPTSNDLANLRFAQASPVAADAVMVQAPFDPEQLRKEQDSAMKKQGELIRSRGTSEAAELSAKRAKQASEQRAAAKAEFIKTISADPSFLSDWAETRAASSSDLATTRTMSKARLTSSGATQILAAGDTGVEVVDFQQPGQTKKGVPIQISGPRVTRFENAGGAVVIPARVNRDAMDDVVTLSASSSPEVALSAPVETFTVNTESDGSSNCRQQGQPCTLRDAIQLANVTSGAAEIDFNIPGDGVHTIHPLAELPVIRNAVTIDGSTQPGYTNKPLIEIKGDLIVGSADGIKLRTSNAWVSDLAINSFPSLEDPDTGSKIGGNGLTMESTAQSPNNAGNILINCYLGTDPTGTIAEGNEATGLNIFDSDANSVVFNVISGNNDTEHGPPSVGVAVTAGNGNYFAGNMIGTNAAGTEKLGNVRGMLLSGNNNSIGGDGTFDGNTVSGNGVPYDPSVSTNQCFGEGIFIAAVFDVDTGELLTSGNDLKGNRVGTSSDGLSPLGNCHTGIVTSPILTTNIGSITQNGRNIVSDNGDDAIHCEDYLGVSGGFCSVSGNNIGTDITGSVGMGNDWRNVLGGFQVLTGVVDIQNSITFSNVGAPGGTTPGGPCTGFCNLISGNETVHGSSPGGGISRKGYGTVGIFNNYIGTNQSGNAAIPNTLGIVTSNGDNLIGLYVSGTDLGNLISGNTSSAIGTGVYLGGNVTTFGSSTLQANRIGTDTSGTVAVPNGPNNSAAVAIYAPSGYSITVGDPDPMRRNIISGNNEGAIDAVSLGGSVNIINNAIGVNRNGNGLGNSKNGILIQGFGINVGGTGQGAANEIANSGNNGVLIRGNIYPTFGNMVRGNSIHDNGGLGIDLSMAGPDAGDGVTFNDECDQDADSGANLLQNFPDLFAPVNNGDGTTTISGVLKSTPSEHFAIDLYSNATADPTGHGEGQTFLAAVSVTTDTNGFASFSYTGTISSGSAVSATATDDLGDTSEFSCNAGATCADSTSSDQARSLAEYLANPDEGCPGALIVNTTGDQDDQVAEDGLCDVDTSTPGLQCTLRAAIEVTQRPSYAGSKLVHFDIPASDAGCDGSSGVCTITPSSALPDIQKAVKLDATSQPGYSGTPLIQLSGVAAPTGTSGFSLVGSASTIRGFVVNGFQFGVTINGVGVGRGQNHVEACFFGTTPSGNDPNGALVDSSYGIRIINSGKANFIGGPAKSDGNLISNLDRGILINTSSSNNQVLNNTIGTDRNATKRIHNNTGILMASATGNVIGGELDKDSNIIAGNINGIVMFQNASRNFIRGNYIGLNPAADLPIGNVTGIEVASGSAQNFIGGSETSAYGNVISNNLTLDNEVPGSGIVFDRDAGSGNFAGFNRIGTDRDETKPIPNDNGIVILSDGQLIGATGPTTSVSPNHIFGNGTNIWLLSTAEHSPTARNLIRGNWIGTTTALGPDGKAKDFGSDVGIFISGDVEQTTISQNFIGLNHLGGITMSGDPGSGPTGNKVTQNSIGTDEQGNFRYQNSSGIELRAGSHGNTIQNNLISCNNFYGVHLIGDAGNPSADNLITGNKIGVDATGKTGANNRQSDGVAFDKYSQNNRLINNILGNNGTGVNIGSFAQEPSDDEVPTGNALENNLIGVGAELSKFVPNDDGVLIRNGHSNVIGGNSIDKANIIGNNASQGVHIFGPASGNTVEFNYIGGVPTGDNIGNGGDGIELENAPDNDVDNNFVLGNGLVGIRIYNSPQPRPLRLGKPRLAATTKLVGNQVGVIINEGGTVSLSNAAGGIFLDNTTGVQIGEASLGTGGRNTISSNGAPGITINGGGANIIQNTLIGTDSNGNALGNAGDGILISNGSSGNLIGGTGPNNGNIIVNNSGAGVRLDDTAGTGNIIDPNVIYSNFGPGIDLGPGGATPNDPGDPDGGPNNLQNYPEFATAQIDSSGHLILTYKVDSDPAFSDYGSQGLYIEFFKADASGILQGQTFLGSAYYTTADHASNGMRATVDLGGAATLGVGYGDKIVATATDASGNTSEFTSTNVGVILAPTAATVIVSGRVLTSSGEPIRGATLVLTAPDGKRIAALTNSFGYYTFQSVEAGRNYLLGVSRKGLTFAQPTRLLMVTDRVSDADFVADP